MSVGTATATRGTGDTIHDYMEKLKEVGPEKALELVIAQTEATKAQAQAKEAEYRALAELEFDSDGRIVKANMAGLWRLAMSYSRSKIVPEQYRGNPDDCFIACQLAFRWKADPMMVMQCSYIVHGKPGIEGKLAIALINSSGKLKGRVRYRFSGEGKTRQCTAFAIDKETGDEVTSTVTWAMALAEGWVDKKGSKWLTIPDVMFTYRSATFLVRQYFPEVLMGMRTVDEIADTEDEPAQRRDGIRTLDDLASEIEASGGSVESSEQEQAPQQKLSEGEIDPDRPEDEQFVEQSFDLKAIEARFDACNNFTTIGQLVNELRPTIPAAQKDAVGTLEQAARDRVQKKLAEARRQPAGATYHSTRDRGRASVTRPRPASAG